MPFDAIALGRDFAHLCTLQEKACAKLGEMADTGAIESEAAKLMDTLQNLFTRGSILKDVAAQKEAEEIVRTFRGQVFALLGKLPLEEGWKLRDRYSEGKIMWPDYVE